MALSRVLDPLPARQERERKFLLGREEAEAFLARAGDRLALQVLDPVRPVEYTRTTYLDTDDLELYRSSGSPTVRRLRIREYASAPDLRSRPRLSSTCFLELKESGGSLRSKLRLAGAPDAIARVVEGGGPRGEDRVALEALAQALEARPSLSPRVTTWYRRECYVGRSDAVRVTVDASIAYLPPAQPGQPVTLERVVDLGPERVLEVKYRNEPPGWLIEALAPLGEARGFSKFQSAMRAVLGGLSERVEGATHVADGGTQPALER